MAVFTDTAQTPGRVSDKEGANYLLKVWMFVLIHLNS